MQEKEEKGNPLIPLMNEGLGELRCRRHFLVGIGLNKSDERVPSTTFLQYEKSMKLDGIKNCVR